MNKYPWMILSVMAAAALPVACGNSTATGGSVSGTHGAGGHSATSSHSSTGSSSSSGTMASSSSSSSGSGGGAPAPMPACDAPTTSPSMGKCFTPPAGGCNPITNAGCMAGEACDGSSMTKMFKCYAPPPANTVAICGMCDLTNTACVGGATCLAGSSSCAKYCCDDGDCGTGKCDKMGSLDPKVGICVK